MKDNRNFGKLNPLFSKIPYTKESISLNNKDGLITENQDLAKACKDFFSDIVNKLGVDDVPDEQSNLSNVDDPILKLVSAIFINFLFFTK